MARETIARKVHFFPFVNGDFGTAVALKWCVSLSTKNNYNDISFSGDGVIEESTSKIQSVDVELEMSSSLTPAIMAQITGQTYDKCKLVTMVEDTPIEGALAYEILMTDGSTRRRVLYNVSLRSEEKSNETESKGETIKFTGQAIPFEYAPSKLAVDLLMDSTEVGKSTDETIKAEYANFFTEIVLPSTTSAVLAEAMSGRAILGNK